MSEHYDMVIIGAGWFGLAAAKVYIELHPDQNVLVTEASGSCGGTWSAERLYPGLKSNNMHGSYEYPGFPMIESEYGVKFGKHIPGATLHRYLTDFARQHGVLERLRFYTRVDSLEPAGAKGWTLVTSSNNGPTTRLTTQKVIIATGLTSTPNMPNIAGKETFNAPLFHAKEFRERADTMAGTKNATVFGGAKSAFDVAYAYAQQGAIVDLVIRPNGNGPVWISHPWVMGAKKKLEKVINTRWMTWFSPCPWYTEDGYGWVKRFLHGTAVGRWMVNQFWAGLTDDVLQANKYDAHPETKKLKPWNAPFWIGSGLSIWNYDTNFLELVKNGKIKVHIADIDSLSERKVHLSTGEELKSDVLVCSTGWRKEPSINFDALGPAGIGLPQTKEEQNQLSVAADKEILERFPRLADQPSLKYKPKNDPFRLYRFIVPPAYVEQRNIAFAGLISTATTSVCAYAQGLWISAFLDGQLDRVAHTQSEITQEVMTHTQWGKWRYPTGYGASLPDFVFDAIPYVDLLLNDAGVNVHRKKGWFNELTDPYGPPDYDGIVDEWASKHKVVS